MDVGNAEARWERARLLHKLPRLRYSERPIKGLKNQYGF